MNRKSVLLNVFNLTIRRKNNEYSTFLNSKPNQINNFFNTLNQHIKCSEDLANHLSKNILYQNQHFVVFEKPNGIAMHAPKYTEDNNAKVNPNDSVSFVAITEAIKILQKKMEKEKLLNVFSQNRLYSGPIVYCFNEEIRSLFSKFFTNARLNKHAVSSYDVVTVGKISKTMKEKEEFYVEKVVINNDPSVVYHKTVSKNRKRQSRGVISKILAKVKLCCENKLAYNCTHNHLQVALNTANHNALQLFCLHKLSPVLGDHLFSSRLRYVLDKPILVDPTKVFEEAQVLESLTSEMLGVSEENTSIIPLHVHCSQLILPHIWSNNGKYTYSNKVFINENQSEKANDGTTKENVFRVKSFGDTLLTNINPKYVFCIKSQLPKFFQDTLHRLKLINKI